MNTVQAIAIGTFSILNSNQFHIFTEPDSVKTTIIKPLPNTSPKLIRTPADRLKKNFDIGLGKKTTSRPVRYGNFYFDYKFDIPMEYYPSTSADSMNSHLNGFIVLDTISPIPLPCRAVNKQPKPTEAYKVLDKIGKRFLKYEDIIFVQIRNPVKQPAKQKLIQMRYSKPAMLELSIQDSIDLQIENLRLKRIHKRDSLHQLRINRLKGIEK